MSSTGKSPQRRSESPKKKRGPTADDLLLANRMSANDVTIPHTQFLLLGGALSLLPIYLAVYGFDVTLTVTNLVLFVGVAAATTYMLAQAYGILFFCEFMKRDVPYSEIKSQKDANLLRSMRLELSMSRSLFQVNAIFVTLSTVMQMYIFKRMDPRASFLMAPLFCGLVAWFASYKSEETRKEKLRGPQ
jgi:hypothetical protein